jgi:hypothetical protein
VIGKKRMVSPKLLRKWKLQSQQTQRSGKEKSLVLPCHPKKQKTLAFNWPGGRKRSIDIDKVKWSWRENVNIEIMLFSNCSTFTNSHGHEAQLHSSLRYGFTSVREVIHVSAKIHQLSLLACGIVLYVAYVIST